MPRRAKGARLHLDKTRREWVIRDGSLYKRIGCPEGEHGRAEKILADYLAHKHKPESGPDPLIADVLLVYAQEHVPQTKAKQNTAYNISSLARWFQDRRVSGLSPSVCRSYGLERTPAAARRDLEVLRAALAYYRRNKGKLDYAPISLPPKSDSRNRWLTRDEARRLRKAALKWPHLYRFVILGLRTGSRSGVLMSLKWDWLDLDSRVMHRRAPGTTEDKRKLTPPVRLGKALTRLLKRWKATDKEIPWVIHYNGRPVRRLKRVWNYAVRDAGLEDVSPHTLRHTRATWLMQAGIDMWEAAGHLGMSPETLRRVYGHHHPDFQNDAAEV